MVGSRQRKDGRVSGGAMELTEAVTMLLREEASELSPRRRDRFELPHVAGKLRPTTHTHARMTVRSAVSFPTFHPTCPRCGNRGLSSDTSPTFLLLT